jgi:uncharacterized membrane protein YidH (DUF202 family)
MFTLSLIALLIATVSMSTMAYFGILKYGETTEDEDSEKTVKYLNKILLTLVIVILASVGIMGYVHYTEKPVNVQPVQIEGN